MCFIRVRSLCLAALLTGMALLPSLPGRPALANQLPQSAAMQQQPSLAAAITAERNGDYTTAEAGYRALAASAQPATAAAGALALGRFLERQGHAADAVAPLQTALTALSGTPDGLRATFLLGEAQADLQQSQAAVASFQAYLAGGGPAAGYAAIEVGWALQTAGDDAGSLLALAQPLQATSVTVRRTALLAAAHAHERLGDPAQAAADQQAIVDTHPAAVDSAVALLEVARLDHLAGDDADAIAALQTVVQSYPTLAAAGSALDRLDALGGAADPVQRAVVLFDLSRNDAAQTAFQSLYDADPGGETKAEAAYYLARIADREDRNDTALASYADAYALAPNGGLAPETLWRRAELLAYLNRYADAAAAYADLVQRFPLSANAAEAAFAAGFMAYLDGRPSDALAAWTPIAQSAQGADAARAELWLGKLAQASGNPTGASGAFARAQALQPSGYFGLRAELLANGAVPDLSGGLALPPTEDWKPVEAWLTAWVGPEDPSRFATLLATQDWTEALELDALGWTVTPDTLFRNALAGAAQQPWALYHAARSLANTGRTTLALEAADDLIALAGNKPGGPLTVPAALLRLAYPLDYADLVNQDAAQQGLDPLLIAAVARQESAFDPSAGSSAGAQGLLQLEPATARDEATALGLAEFTAADLKRPLINLQLGTGFLALQAKAAGRNLNRTLAAYNAGGGNALRWAKAAAGDSDRFYQAIDFSETRRYLRLVSENYAIYNSLYRGAAYPTLRHPGSR